MLNESGAGEGLQFCCCILPNFNAVAPANGSFWLGGLIEGAPLMLVFKDGRGRDEGAAVCLERS